MLSPLPGAVYSLSSQLSSSVQQLPVQTLAGPELTGVSLWADGGQLASFSAGPYVTWWPLSAGAHRFWAQGVNAAGQVVRSETVEITVAK